MAIEEIYPSVRPSLDLNFARSKSVDPRITFARASAATYYDGRTVVKAEENLLVNSQSFGTPTWILSFSSSVGNSISAPDGTLTATKLLADNSQNYHGIRQGLSLPVGNVYTMSVYAKAAEFSKLYFSDLANGRVAASFDLVAISSTNPAHSPGYLSSSISDVGGGWRRCVVTFSAGSSTISLAFAGYPDTGAALMAAGANYIGDGVSGIYIWGAQLEQRSQVTAYTPTTTQPITNYIPVLQTAPTNVPRIDHDPVTGECKGLLVEEQRTNLLLRSEEFESAAWSKSQSSIVANAMIAPDRTLTADIYVENTATLKHELFQSFAATSGTSYTFTLYAKQSGRNIGFEFSSANFGSNYCAFDLFAGTVLSGTGATIQAVGNGWYRCSVTKTATASGTATAYLQLANNTGSTIFAGDGYSGIYIWGAQLEAGAFPTSYIKTEASQVTRAADSAQMTGANFSSWYRQDEGTLFADSKSFGPATVSGTGTAFSVTDGTINNRIRVGNYVIGDLSSSDIAVSGVAQASWSASIGATYLKSIISYKRNDVAAVFNAGAVQLDNGAQIPMVNQCQIGNAETGRNLNGHIKRIAYYPKRLTDAQLQALTA